ncbi:uncharacterized protein si:ch211-136m16.8 [Rhinichthys klamathensis goyatoka]|uniref:uncharacterized protein si:ch211-136m16.8 n=1 Tax=Rhinichthys klamathensis goyatoka TaxID=3034132 RepID=UPI0024B4E549|nr:uncharacterized protein si:ch211-136m16.8 [Rhinichthys klamathensis goyatoka]
MDAPETSVNRIGRTIWTVWGYLSGAVARYLRPEVTDEGNQHVCSRSDQIDLTAANKINREVKANSSEKEENKSNHNDKSTGEVKCSLPEVKVQVASVQWEKTDVVKDDKNDEPNVDTARKQAYSCAMWSAETDHEESISGDSESRGCKSGTHVEKEAVSSDEGQAERVYANSKDSEIVQELDETGRIEQKDGNNEEYDQKYEDENCSKKREDPDNSDVTAQSELYRQDVEQEKQIMMDHGETECIGGFEHAGFIDEMEKKTVGLKERVETEIDEDQGPELQVPADAFVLAVQDLLPELDYSAEEADGLSNPERLKVLEKYYDEIAEFCKNEVEEMIPENRGATESEQDTIKSDSSCDTESDTHVENEEVSSNEGQTERGHADSECKESETPLELDKTGQTEQKDDIDEECDQNHEDEKCEMKSEDPDNAEVTVQSELYGLDVEQEKQMNMMDHGETESTGGFRHAGEHLIDEKEKNIVDQNDHEKTEIDEDQGPELQVPADAFVLEEGGKLLGETMEVENASRGAVKHIEPQSSPECETNEADGRHDQIQNAIAGETESSGHEDFMEISRPGMKRGFDRVNKDIPVVKIEGQFDLDLQAFEDSSLDFSVQKSRIAVKNPLVRPPKDPRKLLYKISLEPRLPQPPACEVSAPSKGGIGFKLPGLGAGMPALRKTEFGKKAREEGESERTLRPQLKSVAVTEDSVKQEPASAKPKWTPPKHPGMGSPLMMAELRNKLKKPVKE